MKSFLYLFLFVVLTLCPFGLTSLGSETPGNQAETERLVRLQEGFETVTSTETGGTQRTSTAPQRTGTAPQRTGTAPQGTGTAISPQAADTAMTPLGAAMATTQEDADTATTLSGISPEDADTEDTGVTELTHEPVEVLFDQGFSIRNLFRGLLGMLSLIGIAWVFSANRKAISWKVVGIGLAIQLLLAFSILQVPPVQYFFELVGKVFVVILDFSKAGTEFLFAGFLDTSTYGFIFAFQVLPTIIFFSALTSLLFYLGIIQKVVYGLAWLMTKAMRLSGAESLSVAGNIFLGQTESPLMIKAYLEKMTRSEILLVMTGGMATMAGGVLAAYISFLGGDDPVQRLVFAKHLLAASIMAAPGAVVISKILMPQTQEIDKSMDISKDRIGNNVLDAISNGTTEGLKLAANVAAMLLVFIAFIAMFNFIVGKLGLWINLNPWIEQISDGQYSQLSLQFILGYVFAPVMWLIGISLPDITLAGRLLGEKVIMTEFIGYVSLAELKDAGAFSDPKSIIMATYMLCGFANFASIGIQIGGIGSLAPGKRVLLSQFGMRALLGGTMAALMSATIVGIILG